MPELSTLPAGELVRRHNHLRERYGRFRALGLSLDMSRGKPCAEQLDLSSGLFDCVTADDCRAADGADCRNYGFVDGLPEARALFAAYLGARPEQTIVGDNSSLAMIHDTVARALSHGVPGGEWPWGRLPAVRILCPCPGYDRHFAIFEHFGVEMLPVAMGPDGPDMDTVESLSAQDAAVKGIVCVPKYSNPTGVTYSDEVVGRLAAMRTAAPDFRIFWDNAYCVHDLTDSPPALKNILDACVATGDPERAIVFGSTSKVTFAGAGVAAMAAGPHTIAWMKRHLSLRTIGPDKLNQLRHVRFLRDMDGVRAHMRRHAELLRPKFEAVQQVFASRLGGTGVAEWSRPQGGYFISLDAAAGCAKAVVALASRAGVKLTPAGATFPYGRDPEDRNIRIAPTLPPLEEVRRAMEVVALCVELTAVRKLLGEKDLAGV
jgi:aspartate/methionine/tyrosine aminotransferase